jgi:hypothetical protein
MRRSSSDLEIGSQPERWSEDELAKIEAAHAEGLSTHQVVELFVQKRDPLTEATFRKYVQLGLLPRSVRVGRKGKHRGSQGLYPATIVRQIERVRRLMAQGYTIEDIQREFLVLGSEIEGLTRQLNLVFDGVERSAQRSADRADEVIARAVVEARALADELVRQLRAIERRVAMRSRMARAAV